MIRCLLEAARIGLVAALAAPAALTAHGVPPQISAAPPSSARIQLSPESLGDLAMARGQYIAAIEEYEQAPHTAGVWNKMGIAYHHLFAFDEAKKDYRRALHLRPRYPQALNNLGAVFYAKKKYGKAEKYYRKSLRLNPYAAAVYSNLAVAYFAQNKVNKGIAAIRQAFELNPEVFAANLPQLVSAELPIEERARQDYCLARLFAHAHNFTMAIDYLRRALDEGFDNRHTIMSDHMLAALRATPQFAALMSEQKAQKR